MSIGQRRHRMELQEPVKGARGDYGAKPKTWSIVATVWGHLRPISGKEGEVARQTHPTVTWMFDTPYSKEFTPLRRLVIGDDEYEIVAALNKGGRNKDMEVLLKEAV